MQLERDELESALIQGVAQFCCSSLVGVQSEFVLQHVLMEAALQFPQVTLETGTQGMNGMSRKEIRLVGNKRPMAVGVQRKLPKGMSLDFMIAKPFPYTMELKARSEFSSQDAAGAAEIWEDIKRVLIGDVNAFMITSDYSIYRLLSHNAQPNRARKYEIHDYFPQVAKAGQFVHECNNLVNITTSVIAPTGMLRVINFFKLKE